MNNDYVPTRITLSRKCGFDETTSRLLGEVARYYGDDPRELAAYLLGQGVAEKARIMEEQLLEQAQWIDQAQTTEAEAVPKTGTLQDLVDGALDLLERTPADDPLFQRLKPLVE